MAQILTPGFLKWDGFKFVLDPDVEGEQGPEGPPGPPGSGGMLVFRPGGVQENNIFNTWEDLMDARALIEGPATIIIDTSIEEAIIDTGSWDLQRNTKIEGSLNTTLPHRNNLPRLEITGNAQFLDPYEFENINIRGTGDDQSAFINNNFDGLNITARNCVFETVSNEQALFEVMEGTNLFNFFGASWLRRDDGAFGCVIIGYEPSTVEVNFHDNSRLDEDVIAMDDGTLNIKVHDWGVQYATVQPNNFGTTFIRYPNGNQIDITGENGDRTVIIGKDNSGEGGHDTCFYFGQDHNLNTGNVWSVIMGGESHALQGNNSACILAGGRYNSISSDISEAGVFAGSNCSAGGYQSVVIGGTSNFSAGLRSAVLAGSNNQAQGESAVVVGGNQGSAFGIRSVTLGGEENQATGDNSISMGSNGNASRAGQFAHGVGSFGTKAQFGRTVLYTTSVNAGAVTFGPDHLLLENGYAYMIRATVVANRVGSGQRACFVNNLMVSCSSGTVTVHNSTSAYTQQPNGTSWTIGYTASGLNLVGTFTAVGATGATVNAVVTYEWTELGNGV